jgi:hypothetical protein
MADGGGLSANEPASGERSKDGEERRALTATG